MGTKDITLLSMLIALAVVGRIYFTFVPNVQPVTVIIVITAFMVGSGRAVIVAALSCLVSNMVLGMGVWTVWQIVSWAVIGLLSGLLGRYHTRINIHILAFYSGLCGMLYGLLISIPMSKFVGNFWAYYLAGVSFDFSHSVGNTLFFYVLYPTLSILFKKFAPQLSE